MTFLFDADHLGEHVSYLGQNPNMEMPAVTLEGFTPFAVMAARYHFTSLMFVPAQVILGTEVFRKVSTDDLWSAAYLRESNKDKFRTGRVGEIYRAQVWTPVTPEHSTLVTPYTCLIRGVNLLQQVIWARIPVLAAKPA